MNLKNVLLFVKKSNNNIIKNEGTSLKSSKGKPFKLNKDFLQQLLQFESSSPLTTRNNIKKKNVKENLLELICLQLSVCLSVCMFVTKDITNRSTELGFLYSKFSPPPKRNSN